MSSELPTIAEAVRLIGAKKLSPRELTQSLLARIAAIDPAINAFLSVAERSAEAGARAAERALKSRRAGRFTGVPLAYEDIFATAGVRTTAQSRLLLDNVPKENAAAVERLATAGTVTLGKLSTGEFAIGGPAFDLPWPPARNPWDRERLAGGSSSGAGAAVAAGLTLGALGLDTSGAIRIPAAYCGTAGLKPTPGLVSRRGAIPLAPSLDTVGPMAWTAEDCALMLDVLAGYDPADPASLPGPKGSYVRAITAPVRGLRVGLVRHFHERDVPATAETLQMIATLARELRKLGCKVGEATLPSLADYNAVGRIIMTAEAYALHEAMLKSRAGEYSRSFRIRVLPGALIRAADYLAAQRRRSELVAETEGAFQAFDILLSAATPGPAPLLNEQRADEGVAVPLLTMAANVAAIPAAVVCGGFSATGLPLGVQIMGPAWGDALVLRLAHHIERAMGTRTERPALASPAARESRVEQEPRRSPDPRAARAQLSRSLAPDVQSGTSARAERA